VLPLDLAQPAPKHAGSFDRTVPITTTLTHEAALRAHYGITRIAELTYLDRIGIPVYSAIVPNSRETISVYNGKGLTATAARAGALMEAAERQAAASARLPLRTVALEHLDPGMRAAAAPAGPAGVVSGYDLIDGCPIDVPIGQVRTSNGLASGNTPVEAVYHALCELIERHVFSVAHAVAHERPRALIARFIGTAFDMPGFIDDAVAVEFTVPTGSAMVDALLTQIAAAGSRVTLRAVELRPLPMVFIATIIDESSAAAPFYSGYGCSLAPEHAAIRAITEAAQGRLSDIHAAREDLVAADDPRAANNRHRRTTALPAGCWFYDAPARRSTLSALTDRSGTDVAADVRALLDALRGAGCTRAAIIDLSPATLPIFVVRAIVPGLETAMVDGAIGTVIAAILDTTRPLETQDLIVR
jgi:ribosomal protein S12 methylthiotransferase accessory factor